MFAKTKFPELKRSYRDPDVALNELWMLVRENYSENKQTTTRQLVK